jgi:molecular chaperone GrpE
MADIENARAEAKAANERYMRLQAEWDNFRKRTAREREEERVRASEALVTKLLPVVDDLERSLDHAAKSAPEGEFGEFVVGVRAVYDKLVDVFDKTGVEAIDPAGTPFDMNEHQAVAHVDDPSLPDGTVRDVYQKGYRMGGRVIRPAMVTVSKGGAPAPAQG